MHFGYHINQTLNPYYRLKSRDFFFNEKPPRKRKTTKGYFSNRLPLSFKFLKMLTSLIIVKEMLIARFVEFYCERMLVRLRALKGPLMSSIFG